MDLLLIVKVRHGECVAAVPLPRLAKRKESSRELGAKLAVVQEERAEPATRELERLLYNPELSKLTAARFPSCDAVDARDVWAGHAKDMIQGCGTPRATHGQRARMFTDARFTNPDGEPNARWTVVSCVCSTASGIGRGSCGRPRMDGSSLPIAAGVRVVVEKAGIFVEKKTGN